MQTLSRFAARVLGIVLIVGTVLGTQAILGVGTAQAQQSCDGSNGVFLYEDLNYGGRCIKLTADVSNLNDVGFNDIVSSIRIRGDYTATLYVDTDYGGSSSNFTSSDSDLRNNTIGLNRASSVRVWHGRVPEENQCDNGDGVFLYEDLDYAGRCIKLTSDRADLDDLGFDNVVSSIRIRGDYTATLYVDEDYEGGSSTFTESDSDLRDNGIGLNRASSVRVNANVPAANRCDGGNGVYLYADRDYAGRCVKLTGDLSDLSDLGANNVVSSIRLVGGWTATLYADQNFGGASSVFVADDPDLRNDGVGDNSASSVRVQAGTPVAGTGNCDGSEGVYLYENPQFGGRCVRFTTDVGDLRTVGFDDTASSIRFVGAWTVLLFRDLNNTGVASSFSQDDANLGDDPLGDNQATSIRVQRLVPIPVENACDGTPGVYLYENQQFGGRCVRFTTDAPDLRTFGFDDTASSVRVVGAWTATLFADLSGTGTATTLTADDPDLGNDAVGDNQVTSVQVRRR